MASAILSVITTIISIIDGIKTVTSWTAGNASLVVSFAEITQIIQGENAAFFTIISIADLDYYRDRFYNVWLPNILATDKSTGITQYEIEHGTLRSTYDNIEKTIREIDQLLNRLRRVYEERYQVLHMDDVTRGYYAIFHGYALLFHLHGVFSQLNCIRINAVNMDDPRLVEDSLYGIQFTTDAASVIRWFANTNNYVRGIIDIKRLGLVPEGVTGRVGAGGNSYYVYQDGYYPKYNIAAHLNLSVASPPAYFESADINQARAVLQQRRTNVKTRVSDVAYRPYWEFYMKLDGMLGLLQYRARLQGATNVTASRRSIRYFGSVPRSIASSDVVQDDAKDRTDGTELPMEFMDANGFLEGVGPDDDEKLTFDFSDPFSDPPGPPPKVANLEEWTKLNIEEAVQSPRD